MRVAELTDWVDGKTLSLSSTTSIPELISIETFMKAKVQWSGCCYIVWHTHCHSTSLPKAMLPSTPPAWSNFELSEVYAIARTNSINCVGRYTDKYSLCPVEWVLFGIKSRARQAWGLIFLPRWRWRSLKKEGRFESFRKPCTCRTGPSSEGAPECQGGPTQLLTFSERSQLRKAELQWDFAHLPIVLC